MSTYERIQPAVFAGAAQWLALHAYAAAYEPSRETKKAAIDYIYAIAKLFPCKNCRGHYQSFLDSNDIRLYLDSADRFFLWTYMCHDGATRAKGETSPDYYETKRFYFESLHGQCDKCG